MNPKNLYIIRHGQTDYNLKKIVQGSGVDSDLNETGKTQAKLFYKKYQHIEFELLLSSSLKRSHQTVAPFVQQGISWIQDRDLDEICWGTNEGKSATPAMIEGYKKLINDWSEGRLDSALPEGESAAQLLNRLERFIGKIKTLPQKNILICSHGRTITCLMTLLKNEPIGNMENYHISNTGLFLMHWDGKNFVSEREKDTSHLEGLS